jgi:hypothetical protein
MKTKRGERQCAFLQLGLYTLNNFVSLKVVSFGKVSSELLKERKEREREMRAEERRSSQHSSSFTPTSSSSLLLRCEDMEEDDDVIVLVDPGIDIGARLFEETKLKKTKTNLIVVVRNHREEEEEKKSDENDNHSSSEQTTGGGALSSLFFDDDDKDESVKKKTKTKSKRTRWDLVTTKTTTTNKKKKIDEDEKRNERPKCTLRLEYWMRSEEMTAKKREHVAKLDELGGYYGVEDHIEKTVFGNDPGVNVVLEENMFPYDCPPGVSHWTLWSREDMKGEEIQEWVSEYLRKHRKDVVEWNYDMNDNCSVDVPHYHVFLRVEDEEYEMKARSKPGEISYSRDERAMNEGASEGGGSKRH